MTCSSHRHKPCFSRDVCIAVHVRGCADGRACNNASDRGSTRRSGHRPGSSWSSPGMDPWVSIRARPSCKDPGIQPWVPFPIRLALAAGSFFVPRTKAPHFLAHTHECAFFVFVFVFFPLSPFCETKKFPPGSQPMPREWEGALTPARLRVGADSQPLSQWATKRQQIALTHQ